MKRVFNVVPEQLRTFMFVHHQILISWGSRMCTFCQDKSFEDNVRDLYMSENLRIYNTKRHRVANSKKWILKWAKHAKHQDTIIKRLQHELQQKEIELRQAIENVRNRPIGRNISLSMITISQRWKIC